MVGVPLTILILSVYLLIIPYILAPMNGEHYDNIFVHYAPKDGSWDYSWI